MTSGSGDRQGDRWGDLLTAAQRSDSDAYRRLLNAIIPFARAIARRRYWSEDMADDVVAAILVVVGTLGLFNGRTLAPA